MNACVCTGVCACPVGASKARGRFFNLPGLSSRPPPSQQLRELVRGAGGMLQSSQPCGGAEKSAPVSQPWAASGPPVLSLSTLRLALSRAWHSSIRSLPHPISLSSQKGREPGGLGAIFLQAAPFSKGHCHSVRAVPLCPPAVSVTLHVGGILRGPFHAPPPTPLAHSLGKPLGFALKDQVVVKVFPCSWQRAARGPGPAEKPGLPASLDSTVGVGPAWPWQRSVREAAGWRRREENNWTMTIEGR